jgi:uncharacterized membrane protein
MKKELTITGLISIVAAVAPLLWWVSQNFHSYDLAVKQAQQNYEVTQELIAKVARLEEDLAELEMDAGRKPMRRSLNEYDDKVQSKLPDWKEGK